MKSLTEEQEAKLLSTLRNRKDAERDYMLVALALNTGLRREELSLLDVGDLRNRETLFVRPEIAKRSRKRHVPLNKKIQGHIKRFLFRKREKGEGLQESSPFFVSRNGNRLCLRAINNIMTKWSKEAALGEIFSPHSLRHTFAARILSRAPVQADRVLPRVQRLLGHANLGSTGIYLKPSEDDLRESVECL